MQPKDSPERTPENDRRMRKKLDKMMKDLVPKQPLSKKLLHLFSNLAKLMDTSLDFTIIVIQLQMCHPSLLMRRVE